MPAARPGGPLRGAAAAAAEPERRGRAGVPAVLTVDSLGPDRKRAAGVAGPRSLFVPAPDKRETDVLSRGPARGPHWPGPRRGRCCAAALVSFSVVQEWLDFREEDGPTYL
ncbi:Dual specificity protein phosphatase 12 [Manis javanica]|nr:Dual specificity protein phosphatase 12 [Manis javanica]